MDTDPQYKTEDGSALRIWTDTAKNNFLTGSLGRPIFDEVIYVEVISPGSKGSTPVFEVVRNFAVEMDHPPIKGLQYEQFKRYIEDFEKSERADTSLAGTPLSEWSEISRTMASGLRASNIFTVEALANLPDTGLPLVGPDGRTWREKAKAYIAASKDSGYATKLAAELELMRLENTRKDEAIQQLSTQITALQALATSTPQAAGKQNATVAAPITLDISAEVPKALGDDLVPAGELKPII